LTTFASFALFERKAPRPSTSNILYHLDCSEIAI
jgi:hypothetical protein